MSNWSELEANVNPSFTEIFGEDAGSYQPKVGSSYPLTVCFGRPDRIEGIDPAYQYAWANRADFAAPPIEGDKLQINQTLYVVFKVHGEGQSIWLALNVVHVARGLIDEVRSIDNLTDFDTLKEAI